MEENYKEYSSFDGKYQIQGTLSIDKQGHMKIKSRHQQPSFKFQTSIAEYEVDYDNSTKGEEKWVIHTRYKCHDFASAVFELPIDWSREYVFNWLSRMEENSLD